MIPISTPLESGSILNTSPLSYLFKLHTTLRKQRIILAFEGGFTQEVTKNILSITESRMVQSREEEVLKKKVFNVMVECLQNICKHADEVQRPQDWIQDGIFMIGKDEEGYFLVSGNFVYNHQVDFLKEKINEVNGMNKSELREMYINKLQHTELSSKGGAGLGLIDIARKSGQKLEYHFDTVDERISFYTLSTKILRAKAEVHNCDNVSTF